MLLNDREQILSMTAAWTGERYPNGRPKVSDEKLRFSRRLPRRKSGSRCIPADTGFSFRGICNPSIRAKSCMVVP